MMKDREMPPFEPRPWLSAVRELVGDTYIIKLFSITIRSWQRWMAKRPYVCEDSIRENYLEKHEQLLRRLMREPSGIEIARACVIRHGEITGCAVSVFDVVPAKTDLAEAMLGDHPPLVELHASIQTGAPIEKVRFLGEKAKQGIDETVALYKAQN